MRWFLCFTLLAFTAAAGDNSLTPDEKKAGWKLLFDGKSMRGWRDPAKETPPGDSWVIEEGCIKTRLKPRIEEDLVTAQSYGDFEMQFDWRISPGGNTGVKYRLQRSIFLDKGKLKQGPDGFEAMLGREIAHPVSDRSKMAPDATGQEYTVAFEFQLIDDGQHADAQRGAVYSSGALYSMIPPSAKAAHPAGEWNQARLLVKGNHVEHWLNGTKVVDGSLDSEVVRAGIAKRWSQVPAMYEMLTKPKPRGPISLQHHGDAVWFRNLKIRPIKAN